MKLMSPHQAFVLGKHGGKKPKQSRGFYETRKRAIILSPSELIEYQKLLKHPVRRRI